MDVCASVSESSSVDDEDVVVDVCSVLGVGVGIGEKVPICRVVWVITIAAVEDWLTLGRDVVVVVVWPDGHSFSTKPPDSAWPSREVDGTFASPQTLARASSILCSALTQPAEHVFPDVKSAFEQPSIGAL